jgi:hypothetical protein
MALSLSGARAGSGEYLSCYRKALKTLEVGLTEETKAKYTAQAKKWTEDKPSPRQQHRYVHTHHSCRHAGTNPHQPRMMEKHSMGTFREFSRYAYNQFGMRVAILAAYCDGDGDPAITLFV